METTIVKSWKREKIRSTQPFFVLDSRDFIQETYRKMGISHFYMLRKDPGLPLRAIPTGCIDFMFCYRGPGEMRSLVTGTALSFIGDLLADETDIFGVRFMPGTNPNGLMLRLHDLIGDQLSLREFYPYDFDFDQLSMQTDFASRVRVFLNEYTALPARDRAPYGKEALFDAVCDMIYNSDGQIRVSELSARTSYSQRYIRRIFQEEMGFSPKTFCSILRLQRAIEFINYGYDEKTADWISDLGFYDQSQCIRDFRKYTGMTPGQYKRLIKEGNYRGKAVYAHDKGLKVL